MAEYRSVFLTLDGRVAARRDFQAENDDEAVIIARALYAERANRDGLALWQGERRVYCEDCESVPEEIRPLATI
jgi:hypothetical protein